MVLEGKHTLPDSSRKARAEFLTTLLDKTTVASDLFDRAFYDFSCLVAERFKDELLGDSRHNATTGSDVLNRLRDQAIHRFELQGLALKDELIHSSSFSRFSVLDYEDLENAFPNWEALSNYEDSAARKQIEEWSIKWNLNADWCRDHAVNVLRTSLCEKDLKWDLLSPDALKHKGWNRALLQKTSSAVWSRIADVIQVCDSHRPVFDFFWESARFQGTFWDYFNEESEKWQRKTMLDFRIWVAEKEFVELSRLKQRQECHPNAFPLVVFA